MLQHLCHLRSCSFARVEHLRSRLSFQFFARNPVLRQAAAPLRGLVRSSRRCYSVRAVAAPAAEPTVFGEGAVEKVDLQG